MGKTGELNTKDRLIIEHVIDRLECTLDAEWKGDGYDDEYVCAQLTAAIAELEVLLKEERREDTQYESPIAGGFMFEGDEEELDFHETEDTYQSRCF